MSLKEKITADMKEAMKAGDKPRLSVIRLILAAVKQKEVDERISLDNFRAGVDRLQRIVLAVAAP